VAGWQRLAGTLDGAQTGAGYVAALIDLGRPPVSSLAEPARELAIARAELTARPTGLTRSARLSAGRCGDWPSSRPSAPQASQGYFGPGVEPMILSQASVAKGR
jgi:hypothetical protein